MWRDDELEFNNFVLCGQVTTYVLVFATFSRSTYNKQRQIIELQYEEHHDFLHLLIFPGGTNTKIAMLL